MNSAPSPPEPRTIVLFGLPFHDVTMAETLEWIDHLVRRRQPAYLVTANLDFAAQASEDVELQRILLEAELVLCDGTPLVWASRMTGRPLQERVAGSDLVPQLTVHAEKRGYRIFLLGGRPEIVKRAAARLQEDHPLLPTVHYFSPPQATLQEMDNAAIIKRIKDARPDILLVAFGCPKQEKWIYMHYRNLGIPCCIGVGATIDFLAGEVSRAPKWMGTVGLEWVYRLAQEPRRLAGRYAKDIIFLLRRTWRESQVIHRASRASRASEEAALPTMPEFDEGMEILRWQGILTSARAEHFVSPSYRTAFIVDLSGVTSVDSRGLGIMLRLVREAWKAEVGVCFYAALPPVLSVLELTRLDRIVPLATTQVEARVVATKDSHLHALRSQSDADSLVVQMPVRITAGNAEDCAQTLKQAWEDNSDKMELILSMEETTFIDSSGLGFLVRAHRMVGARPGASLRLLKVGSNVENVIRVARLDSIFIKPPQPAQAAQAAQDKSTAP